MKPILEHLATTPATAQQTVFWFFGLLILVAVFILFPSR
jgi:hypothetical protein